jgi:hypothetical protein
MWKFFSGAFEYHVVFRQDLTDVVSWYSVLGIVHKVERTVASYEVPDHSQKSRYWNQQDTLAYRINFRFLFCLGGTLIF